MAEALFFIPLALLLHSYVVYPLLVALLASIFGKKYRKDPGYRPTVSVLISAYNEEKVIRATIDALLASDYPPEKLEIIVGSDNSSDRTPEIMNEICTREPRVKFMQSTARKGKPGIMNWIAQEAKGEIFVLCDSNMLFDSKAIANLVENFSDERVGGVSGEIHLKQTELANQETSYWGFESWLKLMEGKLGRLIGANGGIYAIRRENYYRYTEGVPQQDDFITTLKVLTKGADFTYDRSAFANEEPSLSNEIEFKRKKRILISNLGSLRFLKEYFFPFRSFTAFAVWSHKILRWMTGTFMILMIIGAALLAAPWNLYSVFLGAIAATALTGLLGGWLNKKGVKIKLLLLFYYFYGTVLAFISGTIAFATTRTSATWEPVRSKPGSGGN